MKRKKRLPARLAALLLALLLLVPLVPVTPASADSADGAVHIANAEDFASFARSCTLDSWSRGRTFILDADLTLEDADYLPVPTFGGTFCGNGHTIRTFSITESLSPAGLFGVLQEGGSITGLNAEGSVTPAGDSMNVGGIAGENRGLIENCSFSGTVSGKRSVGGITGENAVSGIVRSCSASGAVLGENMTGGVAGCSLGSLLSCRNDAYINVESTDPSIDLDDLDLSFSLDVSKLSQLNTANIATDTGGIAGYSSGIIGECVNAAAVGYQHIGYNIGGVAGRSCGQVYACRNEGAVCGRKDVGGIVGQMEPYVRMEVSESLLQTLQTQLDELSALVNRAADHADGSSSDITARLNSMSGYVDNAANELNNVRVNANIDSTITGSGAHSSTTEIGGGKGAAAGADHEHSSSGFSSDIWAGVGAGVGVDHSGQAGGEISGSTQIVAAPDLGGLTSSINGLSSQATMLNSAASSAAGTLTNDIRAINRKCNELADTMLEAVTSSSSADIISDTSSIDIDAVTLGKVSDSSNEGTVYGDINTGGVAGSAAVEYALDPEDDVTASISGSYRRQYEYKAILQRCANTGSITGKRSYAGGICGRMDLGLITDCESYGAVSSENGSYVGGIAGLTGAVVRNSYAKCTLSGKKYVGGIVGSGIAEKASGSASTVAGCYSVVDVTGCEQYKGAISGGDAGDFLENYYVSETLAGINRQGYAGRAEPISYDQLTAAANLPERMKQFTLRFVADGKVVLERGFAYGASFPQSDIPEPPQKDGCSVRWDNTDLTDLRFDTTVTAVYEPYTPALASVQQRDDGKTVFLVEGQYTEGDAVRVVSEQPTPEAFGISGSGLGDALGSYFSRISRGDFSSASVDRSVLEQWSLAFADDGQPSHTVRYLAPDGQTDHLRIYVRSDGGDWEEAEYSVVGSYLAFPVYGSSAEIAAVSTLSVWWVWLAAALVLLALLLLAIRLIRGSRRGKRPSGVDIVSEAEEVARGANLSSAAPGQLASVSAPLPHGPSAQDEPDAQLAAVEEALRAMRAEREGQGAQPPEKRRRRALPIILIVLALLLAAAAFLFFRTGLQKGVAAYLLLESRMNETPLAMDVSADVSFRGTELHADAAACRVLAEDTAVTAIQLGGAEVYCANGAVYLSNGKAYASGGACPDYGELLRLTAALCRTADVTETTDGDSTLYCFSASGEDAAAIAHLFAPAALADAAAVDTLSVALTAERGKLTALRFSSGGTDSSLALTADVAFRSAAETPDIPEAARSAIRSGDAPESVVLTEETLRLAEALGAQLGQDALSADLTLSADCGPVALNRTVQYDRQVFDGQSVSCIRSGALSLYVSGGRICDAGGNSADVSAASLADSAQLVSLCCELLMDGTASCVRSGDGFIYTLSLDESGMAQLAAAIAPGSKEQAINFSSGSIEASVAGSGAIRQIDVQLTGSLHLALADAPASFSAVIVPSTRAFSFSQPALNALKQ